MSAGSNPLSVRESECIGEIRHPQHGTYYIYYDSGSRLFGFSRTIRNDVHCGYKTLEALMKMSGL